MSNYSGKQQVAVVLLSIIGMVLLGMIVGCGGVEYTPPPAYERTVEHTVLSTEQQVFLDAAGDVEIKLYQNSDQIRRRFDPMTCVVIYTEYDGGVGLLQIRDLWGVMSDSEIARRFPGCSRQELRGE